MTTPQNSAGAAAPAPVLAVDLVTDPAALPALGALARALEAAGIGALTLSDGGLHPVHVAAHLAPATTALGLLPRTDAVHVEPFHLATQLMSLDHVAAGRAGWLLAVEDTPEAAHAVGREVLGAEAAAQEAADVLTASRLVWDSWAEDAEVRDAERGLYIDAARLQYADFEGETFSVRGPAITPRSPQGVLPVLLADADRAAAGEKVAEQLADGRALDVDLTGLDLTSPDLTDPQAAGDHLRAVVAGELEAAVRGDGASAVRLVRLVGLDLSGDPQALAARLGALAASLREDDLVAPAPAAGTDLRAQLGLPAAVRDEDPARRADRARLAAAASTTEESR
ncbi:LLM class flavin-dependent oxidoreductase [Brachybacterium rhamnosum]|uniref:LLM class flavin-dependent oxidoreductase n=1 Tax=Brachybacterium rhamnosum TaxID=173361 RepID=A0ABW4PW99_9MICO